MSSILSIIVAIVVGLTGLCGSMSAVDKPVSLEAGITVDGDLSALMPQQEGSAQGLEVIEPLKKLLNALKLRFAADPSAAQLEILLDGASAASVAVKAEDEGWAMVSTLFPATKLTVSNETLNSFNEAATANMSLNSAGDTAALGEAIGAEFEALFQAFRDKAGETETGSFSVGGVEFTSKTPYNITTKEAAKLILETLKKVLSNENVASFAASLGQTVTPEQLDEALENIEASKDEEVPALILAEYANDAGDTGLEVLLQKDDQSMGLTAVTVAGVTTANLDIFGQLTASLVFDQENKQFDMNAAFASGEANLNLAVSVKAADDRSDFSVTVAVPMGETPITLDISGAVTHDAPVFEEAEGLKIADLESMMKDEEAAAAFGNEFQVGLLSLLTKVMQQYPELAVFMNNGQSTPAQ